MGVENIGGRKMKTLKAWFSLARISNLPTIAGNCLAGMILAGSQEIGKSFLFLFAANSLFYMAGMFLNDVCDYKTDFFTKFL